MASLLSSAGMTNATTTPQMPASCSDKLKSFTLRLRKMGGADATSRHTTIATRSRWLLSRCPKRGDDWVISPKEGKKTCRLLPSVFAMRGNTESVSSAGKRTTIMDANFTTGSNALFASKPQLKSMKFRLTEGFVFDPELIKTQENFQFSSIYEIDWRNVFLIKQSKR